jgi:hypothetical protein
MVPRASDKRPDPPTTAVVQVADDGTATLYLGTELVKHAVGVDAATVMRVLVDYAATLDGGVRVTTQMPDGTWTRHWLDPSGTVTEMPNALPARLPEPRALGAAQPASMPPKRPNTRARIMSRAPAIAALLLFAAILVAAAISGASR